MVAYDHILCVLYTVTLGYVLALNATEYEFDVSVYSPLGTVVFEALLFVENANNFTSIVANFAGTGTEYSPFSINGDNLTATFFSIERDHLLRVALDEMLHLNDTEAIYEFRIDAVGFLRPSGSIELRADVIIHEFGKLASYLLVKHTFAY